MRADAICWRCPAADGAGAGLPTGGLKTARGRAGIACHRSRARTFFARSSAPNTIPRCAGFSLRPRRRLAKGNRSFDHRWRSRRDTGPLFHRSRYLMMMDAPFALLTRTGDFSRLRRRIRWAGLVIWNTGDRRGGSMRANHRQDIALRVCSRGILPVFDAELTGNNIKRCTSTAARWQIRFCIRC